MSCIKKADRTPTHEIHITVTADTPITGKLSIDRQVPIAVGMRVINILLGNEFVQAIESAKPKTLDLDAPVIKNGKVRKKQTCKACGLPGHRRDTCPNGDEAPDRIAKSNGYKPTSDQKADIEDRLRNGESVLTVVSETGAPLAYVNVVRARLNRDGEL